MSFFKVTIEAEGKTITFEMESEQRPTYAEASTYLMKDDELRDQLPAPAAGTVPRVTSFRVASVEEV